jgi:8-oxo-dGTP pyrophosphatase MutT (NUDIX family)
LRHGFPKALGGDAEEETGFRVRAPRKLFEASMNPGSVPEKLHFFAAEVDAADQVSAGGGEAHQGEDIKVVELPLHEALTMIDAGVIQDGKTIMLLQRTALRGLAALRC